MHEPGELIRAVAVYAERRDQCAWKVLAVLVVLLTIPSWAFTPTNANQCQIPPFVRPDVRPSVLFALIAKLTY